MGTDPIESLVRRVDVERLREDVMRLSRGDRHSLYSPVRHAECVEYISTVFAECGLETSRQSYETAHELAGRSCINIMGLKSPASPQELPSLLVSAHYDTVHGSSGADDNASGVAALLECARLLSKAQLRRPVQFIAFDMEETQPEGPGLVGSSAFIESAVDKSAYAGLYNLEMVGYTSGPGTQGHPPGFHLILPGVYERVRQRDFRGDFIAIVAQGSGIEMARRFADAAGRWVPNLSVLNIEVNYTLPILADIFRSDHAPFWAAGVPAVMVTDTAEFRNPNYHQATDTLDTLDFEFMGNVTRALIATLAQHGEIC